ncbi:MAG TPA: phosphoribosylformylglycinamidine cyclo-ligase [Vicinamibacterales bacterium]|nr:phosphoribosylformylglycinamidine cyclo-ligase [Vicinamibacterales bacterium]
MTKYRDAGVDIDAGNETVRRIRGLARATFTPGVLSDIGSFGGLFKIDHGRYREPVLVSSADGVGTKLKVAFMTGRHDTVGADLVNHCVNDILVQGAEPLFFLDYLAAGRLSPAVAEQVIGGIARACQINGCALIGGETAEMPGFYADGEYDIAGFIVGIVEQGELIDGRGIVPGDALIGLPSAGLHTNGYSLARRVFFEVAGWSADTFVAELGTTAGDALMAPHRSYLAVMRGLLRGGAGAAAPTSSTQGAPVPTSFTPGAPVPRSSVKGLAHITGGGITENLPRVLPEGCAADIDTGAWDAPPIFRVLAERGGIPRDEMFRAFNMGIGLVVICGAREADRVVEALAAAGEPHARRIGSVIAGDRTVRYR